MIRHIVCFRLVADTAEQRTADAKVVRTSLEGLVGRIPQLRHLEVGDDLGDAASHWDLALLTDFDSTEDLRSYQSHPDHVTVIRRTDPLVADRAIVDYRL
jgi:hypothetical protein